MQEIKYLIIPFSTLIICQLIKFIIESVREKKLMFLRLFNGTGGMPSSHTSLTFSLAFTILFNEGYASPLFAISLVTSMIVAYDAMGLRMESGKQAHAINMIVSKIFNKEIKKGFIELKEQLGHKPLEVLGGIILALITSSIFFAIL